MTVMDGAGAGRRAGHPRSMISLVSTVLNEERSVVAFVESLLAQSRPPDEIIIVDGGSTDSTVARMQAIDAGTDVLRIVVAPGANISAGRNAGIRLARHPLVAVTDAGTRADRDWLERLAEPLEADERVAVASGFFRPGGDTFFERVLSAVVTPTESEIDPDAFLPSSRSIAFRKEWWERVNGYPEWLQHCEDLVFDLELRRAGAQFQFVPEACVVWSARANWKAFARQYFYYARGDGHAGLWPKRHLVRYAAYLLGTLLCGQLVVRPRSWCGVLLATGFYGYMGKFWRRVAHRRPAAGAAMCAALAATPAMVIVGDVAKMAGYPVGLVQRRRLDLDALHSSSDAAAM